MVMCDCSVDFDNGPTVCHEEWRKARKIHHCCECGDPIAKGEVYEYVAGLWDGYWNDHCTCKACVKIRKRYCSHGWVYGEVAQQIEECLGFDYREVPEGRDPTGMEEQFEEQYEKPVLMREGE